MYDEFTHIFKSYIDQDKWFNVYDYNDKKASDLIKSHHLDMLIDLAGHGIGNRMSVLSLKPAPVIINYLGYPATTNLKEITHRIGDRITDPDNEKDYSEKMIYLPRCFVCYTLFSNVDAPEIKYKLDNKIDNKIDKSVFIGVFNKSAKQNIFIRNIWKNILSRNKHTVLCVKLDSDPDRQRKLYEDIGIPKNQLKYFEFTDTLEDYLELFNEIDFCIDTYPYSGTTTTCSSLLMGVPTFTIYKGSTGKHVNNVSASILKSVFDCDKYVCTKTKEYKDNIGKEIKRILNKKLELSELTDDYSDIENKCRQSIREQFLKAMDPDRFMKEYEGELLKLV